MNSSKDEALLLFTRSHSLWAVVSREPGEIAGFGVTGDTADGGRSLRSNARAYSTSYSTADHASCFRMNSSRDETLLLFSRSHSPWAVIHEDRERKAPPALAGVAAAL
jgi:hypothetical protein